MLHNVFFLKDFFMKFRNIALFALVAILLTACNLSLAEDITPPPGYIPPTAGPTMGPLYPPQAANIENGAAIFAEKCSPCHGTTGLGDGPQGKQLPVPVAALGLPQTAQKAAPSRWFTVVTQGNIERFMPPFVSLSDQERWDVVAYALSLHTSTDMIAQGQTLFEANCADCPTEPFTDQQKMAALSDGDLVSLMQEGNDTIPAFGAKLSETELYSVAAYLRSLTFAAAPSATPTTAPVTPTTEATATSAAAYPNPAEGTAVAVQATPTLNGTAQAQATAGTPVTVVGSVRGSVINTAGALPANLTVTLRGYDHAQDATSGPQETLTLTTTAGADGSLLFENVELIANRLLLVEAEYKGIAYQSEFAVVEAGASEVSLLPLTLYNTSSDFSKLTVDQSHIFLEVADGKLQVIEFLNLTNPTQTTIIIPAVDNQMALVKMPAGMTNLGYDAQQGEATPVSAADGGFALPPSEKSYGVVAGFETPYTDSAEFELPFVLGMPSGSVLVPAGIKLEGAGLTDMGQQDIGSGSIYQAYEFGEIKPGDSLSLKLTGTPKTTDTTTTTPETKSNQPLIIGAGVLGLALIGLGAWLYLRDRKRADQEDSDDNEEAEFEDSESVLDAIIALDDLHRAGKLPDEAYQKRRAELKEQLKRKS